MTEEEKKLIDKLYDICLDIDDHRASYDWCIVLMLKAFNINHITEEMVQEYLDSKEDED